MQGRSKRVFAESNARVHVPTHFISNKWCVLLSDARWHTSSVKSQPPDAIQRRVAHGFGSACIFFAHCWLLLVGMVPARPRSRLADKARCATSSYGMTRRRADQVAKKRVSGALYSLRQMGFRVVPRIANNCERWFTTTRWKRL